MNAVDQDGFDDLPFFPLIEIFGGAFGVLMLLLVAMIHLWDRQIESTLNAETLSGISDVHWQGTTGRIIEVYPNGIRLGETNQRIFRDDMASAPELAALARRQRQQGNRERILLLLYPSSNDTYLEVRRVFRGHGVDEFAWLVLNREAIERLLRGEPLHDRGAP